jgi:hypothetical protein
MSTVIVERSQDQFCVRYVRDAPFVVRVHRCTATFNNRISAILFIEDQSEEMRPWLHIEERTQYWEEEVTCDHLEWVWHSKGMMACTSCGTVHPVECNESPEGTHSPYLAGPRTNEWLCAHCLTSVEAPNADAP